MGLAEGLKSVAKLIPGVTGYMSREELRETDKVVRGHVVKSLEAVKGRVENVKRTLVDEKKLMALGNLDRVTSRIDRVRNRVNGAAYGDKSFFSELKIDETVLNQLIEFDRSMGEKVLQLADHAAALEKAGVDEAAIKTGSTAMESSVQQLDELFTSRDSILGK
jgi:hypothetical protein